MRADRSSMAQQLARVARGTGLPEANHIVAAAIRQAVLRDIDKGKHLAGTGRQPMLLSTVLDIPGADRSIVAGRRQPQAVSGKHQGADSLVVRGNVSQEFPAQRVKQPNSSVSASQGQRVTVRGKGDGPNVGTMRLALPNQLPRCRVQTHFPVKTGRRQFRPVRTVLQRGYRRVAPGQNPEQSPFPWIPDDDPAVIPAGRKRGAVGRKCCTPTPIQMAWQTMSQPAALQIPNPHDEIVAGGGQQLFGGVQPDRGDNWPQPAWIIQTRC